MKGPTICRPSEGSMRRTTKPPRSRWRAPITCRLVIACPRRLWRPPLWQETTASVAPHPAGCHVFRDIRRRETARTALDNCFHGNHNAFHGNQYISALVAAEHATLRSLLRKLADARHINDVPVD